VIFEGVSRPPVFKDAFLVVGLDTALAHGARVRRTIAACSTNRSDLNKNAVATGTTA
jgi:hypothetical protein